MKAMCLFWNSTSAPRVVQYQSTICSRRLVCKTRCDSFFGDAIVFLPGADAAPIRVNEYSLQAAFENGLRAGSTARQPPAAAVGQCVEPQLDRVAEPDRVAAVILDRILGQRVDQHIEPLAVQHQKRHDMLELVGLE